MTIRSKLEARSTKTTAWAALEEVNRAAIDSMSGAGGHTRTVIASVERRNVPPDEKEKWSVSVEIETVIP